MQPRGYCQLHCWPRRSMRPSYDQSGPSDDEVIPSLSLLAWVVTIGDRQWSGSSQELRFGCRWVTDGIISSNQIGWDPVRLFDAMQFLRTLSTWDSDRDERPTWEGYTIASPGYKNSHTKIAKFFPVSAGRNRLNQVIVENRLTGIYIQAIEN